jgi:hypothetical protein
MLKTLHGKTLLLILSIVMLSGCRLLITADPGGAITSDSGNYDCAANTTCPYTIPEANFLETFTATAAPGYKFANWTNACQDSNDSVCQFLVPTLLAEEDRDWEITANFNRPLVGTWLFGDLTDTNESGLLTFYEEGYYLVTQACFDDEEATRPAGGHEYGSYSWNAATGAFSYSEINGSIGGCGLVDTAGVKPFNQLQVSADGNTLTISGPGEDAGPIDLARITNGAEEPIEGTWLVGDITDAKGFGQVTFYQGSYVVTQDCEDESLPGMEVGSYIWNPSSKSITVNQTRDTLGECGLTNASTQLPNIHRVVDKGGKLVLVDFINNEAYEAFGLF